MLLLFVSSSIVSVNYVLTLISYQSDCLSIELSYSNSCILSLISQNQLSRVKLYSNRLVILDIYQIQMKEQKEKFPSKKLFQLIQREQTSLIALKGFFKATVDGQTKGLDCIRQFTKEIGIATKKVQSRQITKHLATFSCHSLQSEQIQETIDLIDNKIKVWIEQISQRCTIIKERIRSLMIRKNSLTQEQINSFKIQLTKQLTWITQRKNSIIKLFCHTKIKHSSRQIQTITNILENQLQGKSKLLKNK